MTAFLEFVRAIGINKRTSGRMILALALAWFVYQFADILDDVNSLQELTTTHVVADTMRLLAVVVGGVVGVRMIRLQALAETGEFEMGPDGKMHLKRKP